MNSSGYRLGQVLFSLIMGLGLSLGMLRSPLLADSIFPAMEYSDHHRAMPQQIPLLQSISPVSNTHTAPSTSTVSISYQENIDPATVSTQTFVVQARQTGLLTQAYNVNTGQISLTPAVPFKPGELVQVSATTGTLNFSGQGPSLPTVWQFTVGVDNGSGIFDDTGQRLGSAGSRSIALGDVNGDGDLDALAGNSLNTVYYNDGTGVFTYGQYLGDSKTREIALGDLDKDGDLDAFISTHQDYPNEVWLNDGGLQGGSPGLFSNTNQSLTTNSDSSSVDLGDLDGDGDLDAFITSYGQANTIWINNGAATFTDSGQRLGNAYSTGVALGDVDGDGDLDAFVGNGAGGTRQYNRVWFNDGQASFTGGDEFGYSSTSDVALGDLDNDGDLDAFIANLSVYGQVNEVWENDGNGQFTNTGQSLGSADSKAVVLGDVDGDGDLDAFVANTNDAIPTGSPNQVWLNQGGFQNGTLGQFSNSGQNLGNSRSMNVALGDVDNDGDLDAFISNFLSDGHDYGNTVWLNQNPMQLVKIAPITAAVGELITYTLILTNGTETTLTNVVMTDTIPTNAHYVNGGTRIGNVISWSTASLPSGQTLIGQFSVTATQTIVNHDYQVTADDGHQIVGFQAIATVIGSTVCPSTPNSVCVLDENGAPVDGALLYRNGQLVTDVNGTPLTTNSQGVLVFSSLNTGETLAALQPVYEQPTHKSAHSVYNSTDFAFRVYRTSMPVDNGGEVNIYLAPGSDQAHTLTLHPENTLILFNVVVSVEWDAGDEYIAELKTALAKTSDALYDATDGHMAFGWVTVFDNAEQWYNADIQIRTHNHTWPHAFIGGINTHGSQHLVYKGIDPEPGRVVLGRYWNGESGAEGKWHLHNGYTTIMHEFAHYALFLFDEYFYYTGNNKYRVWKPSHCSFYDDDPASVMFYQYDKTEFCNRPDQYPEHHDDGPPTRHTQVYGPNETSWITIQGVYSDVLQSMSAGTTPWRIISPVERGVPFVTGPSQPLLDLPEIQDNNHNIGTFTRKPVTVQYEGQPVWGALVALYKNDGTVLNQGLTDREGYIEILGAASGDTIRVRTPENSLGGSMATTTALPETLQLTPVILGGQSSSLTAQDAITNNTPLITVFPNPDGTTMEYFMAQTGELTDPVYANILGAQAPPLASKTMAYNAAQDHYYVNFSGYQTGTLTGLTFQMTTTVSGGFIEVGIGHDRSHTDDTQDDLNLTTTDGNLILNAPGGSFDSPTYVVANPTNAIPGTIPPGRVLIGEAYSIQYSGWLTGSLRAMSLNLGYQTVSLGDVVETTLQPYYWSSVSQQWLPVVSYTHHVTNQQVSASTNVFGIYALLGEIPGPAVTSLTPVSGTNTAVTPVVVKGNNFETGARVRIGSAITLTTVTFVDSETLLISIPSGLLTGFYDITVINPNGQSGTLPNGFQVTGIDPEKVYLPVVLKSN